MGLLDIIAGWFGREPEPVQQTAKTGERKNPSKQIYGGKDREPPEWAVNLDQSQLTAACAAHAVCKFTPHIEWKRIMSARTGLDGNLETEYEGVACDCGAIKSYGKYVAARDGYAQPYRYVDLNYIFSCCCDTPRKCTFYSLAAGHDQHVNKRMKRVGGN